MLILSLNGPRTAVWQPGPLAFWVRPRTCIDPCPFVHHCYLSFINLRVTSCLCLQVSKKYRSRQKTQSIDLDELLGNSPPWPPVSSPGEMYGEEDREIGSGDWVDKVMVNKQDGSRGTVGGWEAEHSRISDGFYQKYLPEQSYNMFPAGNGFDVATTDDLDDLDAATSDSSEPDLVWQFNNSKLSSLTNGTMSKLNNLNAKSTRYY